MVRHVAVTGAPPGITAVLPAYNEEANLERTVRDLAPVLAKASPDHEIIVVDDGSADRTAEVAARLGETVAGLRLLHHPRNLGYGEALRTGFAAATREWILLLDADGQFLPPELDRLLAAAPESDLVLGYRKHRADSAHRRGYATVWRLLMWMLLGVRVRDVNCGFKLMRTAFVQSLDLRATGALISAELLAKAQGRGARMMEVEVSHRPRLHGHQTGGDPRVLLRAYVELARLWWRIRQFSAAEGAPRGTTAGSARRPR